MEKDILNRIELIKKYIEKVIKDKFLREELKNWIDGRSYLKIGNWKNKSMRNKNTIFIILFISKLKEVKIENINWQLLCRLYNLQIYQGLKNLRREIPEYKFSYLNNIVWFIESKDSFLGYKFYRSLIFDFYENIYRKSKFDNLENVKNIGKYIHLFENDLVLNFDDLDENNEFKKESINIYSNLPTDSFPENIVQYTNVVKRSGKIIRTNYNLNGVSEEIKTTVIMFLDEIHKFDDKPHKRELKKFITLFTKICVEKNITKTEEFTFDMLKKFVNNLYYERKNDDNKEKVLSNLIRFYRVMIQYGENGLKEIEKEVIKSLSISKVLKENYYVVEYNQLDRIPKENKFCFYRNANTMKGGRSTNDKMYYIDLTDIRKEYSEDIKEYIWYANKSIKHKVGYVYQLKNFLKMKDDFYRFKEKNSLTTEYRKIGSDYLVFFKKYIEDTYENISMQASVVGEIKSFLRFHKVKYEVNNIIDTLMKVKKPKYDGGNPIYKEDLKVIYNGFVEDAKINNNNIFKIAFELNLCCNLRIGEILNLRRNCIVDEKTILVEGKMTDGNFKRVEVTPEVIRLIKAAIEETEKIHDRSIIGKYIFIESRKINFVNGIKLIDFRNKFITILESVKGELRYQNKGYSPYCLRDTFIDDAYNYGIKNDLGLNEISKITGNSYKTALRHYRKRDNYELYVEQLAKVNLKNAKIDGEILKDDDNYSVVRGNLGGCKRQDCDFDIGECLMCSSFVTFTNRLDIFEGKICEITNILKNDIDVVERRRLEKEKLLLAKYLYNMYKLEGERNV